jgi:hypothetical protein
LEGFRTVPVNHYSGLLIDDCDPMRFISFIPPY